MPIAKQTTKFILQLAECDKKLVRCAVNTALANSGLLDMETSDYPRLVSEVAASVVQALDGQELILDDCPI